MADWPILDNQNDRGQKEKEKTTPVARYRHECEPVDRNVEIGIVAYHMQLPSTFGIHDVFHVTLLRPYTTNGRVQPPPPPLFEEDASYEVECMLSHEHGGSHSCPKESYPIKWIGCALEHNS